MRMTGKTRMMMGKTRIKTLMGNKDDVTRITGTGKTRTRMT